jgi:hypothetical protein
MGRRPRATPPWSSAKLAQAECKRLLGDELYALVLKGLRSEVRRPGWQSEAVMLAKLVKKLGPMLRDLVHAVKRSRALEGEPKTAIVPDSVRESIEETMTQLEALPVPSHEVFKFFERLKNWLEEGRALMDIARRMQPRGTLGDADQRENGAIADYLVTFDTNEERPITKQIAALLEVANGEEVPGDDADARAGAWEKCLERWKKALVRARARARAQRPAPMRRGGGRKLGRDKRPAKPASVPRK